MDQTRLAALVFDPQTEHLFDTLATWTRDLIFVIMRDRRAKYWMDQAFPVMLVIRNSDGKIRWMEVRDWLKEATNHGKKPVRQIVFEPQRFDVMSVRRWRDEALGE